MIESMVPVLICINNSSHACGFRYLISERYRQVVQIEIVLNMKKLIVLLLAATTVFGDEHAEDEYSEELVSKSCD